MSSDEELETNFTSGKEKELEDLLSKLDFISNIQEDEIIYVNSLSKAGHSWSTSMHRTLVNCGGLCLVLFTKMHPTHKIKTIYTTVSYLRLLEIKF